MAIISDNFQLIVYFKNQLCIVSAVRRPCNMTKWLFFRFPLFCLITSCGTVASDKAHGSMRTAYLNKRLGIIPHNFLDYFILQEWNITCHTVIFSGSLKSPVVGIVSSIVIAVFDITLPDILKLITVKL